jgi:Domain of unknown function (DUF3482)/50S ribosome-binding GTPase
MIDAPATIEIALISHTNAGKTTLARTLLGRDVGIVRDAPHVTDVAESHTLLTSAEGDALRLTDTPGFGDSARLVQRLRVADNPLGWLLREVWDRHRDRPFWCSQQAVRAARESADALLYLVNAAEDPVDAGYVPLEMQVLRWVGKPVIVLLNQAGPPRAPDEERRDVERWRAHLAPHGVIHDVLAFDAFARCWVQERVLLDAIAAALPAGRGAALARLRSAWERASVDRFEASMRVLADELVQTARDAEPVDEAASGTTQKLLRAVGVGRSEADPARERAMAALAARLDAAIRTATERLIALHGLEGDASQAVLQRMQENFAVPAQVDEARAALLGSIVTGALTGLKADLAAGGLTFGAGMLVGGVVGGLAGAGLARGVNVMRGAEHPSVRWSEEFLDGLVRSSVLRYLAVAHFGRGRGRYVEGEAPSFWKGEVEQAMAAQREALHDLWRDARTDATGTSEALGRLLRRLAAQVLERLYPGCVPAALLAG